MGTRTRRTIRRLVALPVATLLVAVGVLVPMLDGSETARGPVLESEHHAASCVVGHDHTICTQAGANLALPKASAAAAAPEADSYHLPPTPARAHRGDELVEGHRSRAPPLVRT